MAKIHIAAISAVKVSIGSPTGNSVVRIVREGEVIPEGVDESVLESLVSRGLVTEVEVEDPDEEESTEEESAEVPEGDPSLDWTGKQLKAYAEQHSVDLGSAKTKPEILAAIQAAA